jgi:Ser/Thr protein kinase RdoA (MazF antagonist)
MRVEHFFSLVPDRILDVVERALGDGARATGRTLALNSMENRVYEIELEDRPPVVTKFYRPGRWSREAISDEHRFLAELVEAEVPAVAPMILAGGETLATSDDGIFFAIFPKVRGRLLQELDDTRLAQIGRLLGRLHNVGARAPAPNRLALTVESYGRASLATLDATGLVVEALRARHRIMVEEICAAVAPLLDGIPARRIHGDCHLGNVLWRDEAPFFLDFDDMVTGPAVQDVWLVVRGRDADAVRRREVLLAGYEQMREFDRSTLRLIEPLRALRMIHYSAWIARRWEDPTFQRAFPDFPTARHWAEEIADLEEQLQLIRYGALPDDN